jgi:hypothetical protein
MMLRLTHAPKSFLALQNMNRSARFISDIRANRNNAAILDRWQDLALPGAWLVAGCLFQTVWNLRSGAAPEAQIKDYDIFYFDPADRSTQGETRTQARVGAVLDDLGVMIEVTNQARVHLWYRDHFGLDYPELGSVKDGIDRFLVLATCVGLRPDGSGSCDLYAPHGLALLNDGHLTPNPLTDHPRLFEAKARSYQARWPWLRIDQAGCDQ